MEVLELLDAKGIPYVPKGENEYSIVCPNAASHQGGSDSSPSFSINVEKLVGNCLSCGFSMNEARLIRWLVGGELEDLSLQTMTLRAKIKRMLTAEDKSLSEARQIFIPPGEPWAEDGYRGISLETYRKLEAIHCTRGFYSDRLVFPVYLKGELLGVDARALKPDMQPKYLRGKGCTCKDNWLTPYDIVADMKPKYVILAEGAFHAYNGIDKGFPTLCYFGSNSWSLTKMRMILNLGIEEVYICRDNDVAGIKAEQEIGSMLEDWLPTYSLDTSKFGETRDLGDLSKEEIEYAISNRTRFKKIW